MIAPQFRDQKFIYFFTTRQTNQFKTNYKEKYRQYQIKLINTKKKSTLIIPKGL